MSLVTVIPAFKEGASLGGVLAEIAELEGRVSVVADLREVSRLELPTGHIGEEMALLKAHLADTDRSDVGERES